MRKSTDTDDDKWWITPCPHSTGKCCYDGCTPFLLYTERRITKRAFEKRVNDCPYRRGGYTQKKLL
jgi:hypothetical protein